jgi:hypothetical protein
LPSKPLGGLSVKSQKKMSDKAKQVKVASWRGDGPPSLRTDIAEAWVPLQGAGSDARLLIRLQGVQIYGDFDIRHCWLPCLVQDVMRTYHIYSPKCEAVCSRGVCLHAGALGERRELPRNPLEETARFTQQTLDNFVESTEAPGGVISRLREFGKSIASHLFD